MDGKETYRCECPCGWAGHNCDADFNECGGSPCVNGGSCVDSTSPVSGIGVCAYLCECAPTWEGVNCAEPDIIPPDVKVSLRSNNPCDVSRTSLGSYPHQLGSCALFFKFCCCSSYIHE